MKIIHIAIIIGNFTFSQDITSRDSTKVVDSKYREDQFYASITYNLIVNNPDKASSSDFSSGFHFGFIRDMPINEKRNWAIGLGLGISTNSYNQNLAITEDTGNVIFTLANNANLGDVKKNKFTTYLVDLPLQIRWRTSNATDYKFWRIYSGFKISYLLYNSSRLESDLLNQKLSNIDAFNKFQYGLTLSAGYGTWNFSVYYGLNSIFDTSAKLNNQIIASKALKIGIMFYIL